MLVQQWAQELPHKPWCRLPHSQSPPSNRTAIRHRSCHTSLCSCRIRVSRRRTDDEWACESAQWSACESVRVLGCGLVHASVHVLVHASALLMARQSPAAVPPLQTPRMHSTWAQMTVLQSAGGLVYESAWVMASMLGALLVSASVSESAQQLAAESARRLVCLLGPSVH